MVTQKEIAEAIAKAVEITYRKLCANFPENYYYITLITSGEADPPMFSAWSDEALKREALLSSYEDPEFYLKWSAVESPYYGYGEENFGAVRELFSQRPAMSTSMTKEQWRHEYDLRLSAMEDALHDLDETGLFGTGATRDRLVVCVEVLPPDSTNTERVRRLNPPAATAIWLTEYDNS